MANQYQMELSIPRNPVSINAAQGVVKSVCQTLEIPQAIEFDLELAVEESLLNLFEYEMDAESGEPLRLRFEFASDEVRAIFSAPGRPFNFDRISEFDYEKALAHDNVEGLGLFMLKNIMDGVQWKYLEKQGAQLIISKKLPSTFVRKEVASGDFLTPAATAAGWGADSLTSLEYRLVRDYEDAFALTSCAYDLYNYEYKDVIYYPNELLARNQAGLMRSWIAVDNKGNVYGHYALMKKNSADTFAETGAAFVRPEFRKEGLFKELAVRLHEDAHHLGLRGLYSLSVTNHIATQKLSQNYGRYTVGIRIASSPAVFVEGAKPGDRTTTTFNYQQIVARPPRKICIPGRYRELILAAYRVVNIEIEESGGIERQGREQTGNAAFFDTYRDLTWNRALISARGDEVIGQKLQAVTDVLVENDIKCITLSLDLEDPGVERLVEAAVKIGYFYSGIFPEGFPDGHDALQMQYLHMITVDPAAIAIYQESGKQIYAFIMSEVPHLFAAAPPTPEPAVSETKP